MASLRILFICPQPLWPTNTGARLRNFHLANALGTTCEVTVLQAVHPADSLPPPPETHIKKVVSALRDNSYTASKIARGLMGPLPLTVLNYQSGEIQRRLAEILRATSFDVVQIESIHMAPYLQNAKRPPKIVLDWHNIESDLMKRYGTGVQNPVKKIVAARTAHLLRQQEQRALYSFDAHTVVSSLERAKLHSRAPNAKIHVIANGVDTASFIPQTGRTGNSLLFVGSMDYHANAEAVIWFCREVWPQIESDFPNLNFKIVGRDPTPEVKALGSPRVIVTGTVADVRPYYEEAFAVMVPIKVGAGTRLKILEAMAANVPIISTRLGAEGIEVVDRQNILLAESPSEMLNSVRELSTKADLANTLCQNARKLVVSQYDWTVIGQKLKELYLSLG